MARTRVLVLTSLAVLAAAGGVAFGAGAATAAPPSTRYVAIGGHDGENDCLDHSDPCATIGYAVAQANAGDVVDVGSGTYDESVAIPFSLTLRGSLTGTTTVDGNGDTPTFFILPNDESTDVPVVRFENLDVSHNGSAPGIFAVGADVHLSDSDVSDNAGGVFALLSTLDVTHSTVSKNLLGEQGSGLPIPFADGSGITLLVSAGSIDHSTMAGNEGSGVVVLDQSFLGGVLGPAVRADADALPAATASVLDSTVSENQEGGVLNLAGDATVDTSTLTGNTGAALVSLGGTADLRNSTASHTVPFELTAGATADSSGDDEQAGVLALPSGVATGNDLVPSVKERAIISSRAAELVTAQKSAIVRKAAAKVTAAAPVDTGDAVISVSGSIVAAQDGVEDCEGPIVDATYNLSSDAGNSCDFSAAKHDLVRTDPKLGPLADNGGPTETEILKKGSPAIDAVKGGAVGCSADAVDQRGIARPQPTGGRCDVGAVELKADPIVIHPNSLPHGQVGEGYSATLSATGGAYPSYVFSVAAGSSLPPGLSLSSAGRISGTPTKAGSFHFTVSVNDPVLKAYTIVIDAAAGVNGNGDEPIASTGVRTYSMTALGAGAVLAGFLLMVGAGLIGRRPGRHRAEQ
jgi:hypothetical protein